MTLKQEAINAIEFLPDEQLPQLIAYIDFLSYTFTKEKSASKNVLDIGKKSRRNLRGLMPGKVVMSEDFNETPDCFEEYM